ncbi:MULTISPECIES: hypothetical protein [Cysteiniphilum]|uniref:hypothetical protein n=1 Tax=Cysteiniphilum TaxID=2056696 RepID=UPI0017863BEC|nr:MULTISPECIES: hypothetical protein [Cysteiniphilum]
MNINQHVCMPYPLLKAKENTERIKEHLHQMDTLDNCAVRNLIRSIEFFFNPTFKGAMAC